MTATIRIDRVSQSLLLAGVIAAASAVTLWSVSQLLTLLMMVVSVHLLMAGWLRFRWQSAPSLPMSELRVIIHQRRLNRALPRADGTLPLSSEDEAPLSVPAEDNEEASDYRPVPAEIVVMDPDIDQDELESAGISTVEELADAAPELIARRLGIDEEDAEDWVFNANLLCHGAGIKSLIELGLSTPEEIVARVTEGPWGDIYDSESDREYLLELADTWIRLAQGLLARDIRDLLGTRRR
ncbi:MAG: hypothetical protein ACTSYX_05010 [Candidatus Thorarchaeota archaeon]